MNDKFADFKNTKIAIAVSGGIDSMALMYMLVESGLRPVVLHVNHGLRDVATAEAEYVIDTAKKLGLKSQLFQWNGEKPTSNLESVAREARYKMMTDYCAENGVEVLMTAHHADDQIETFLMNLGRGSGVYGLAAMRRDTMRDGIKIVRPLLNVFRATLEKYCHDNNIKYFIDEMNSDDKYTRVKIRKNRHLMADKLGISDERILLAIDNLSRVRDSLDADVLKKIDGIVIENRADFTDSFLFDAPLEIRLKLLGRIIQQIGKKEYQPRLNSLESALHRLGNDCKFTLGGCVLRRLGNKILIVPTGESTSFRKGKHAKQKQKSD